MTTKAGAGHFGPLIPFARAFQRAGADVLVAAPREAAAMVRAEGLPLWAFDDPPAGERDAIFAEVRAMSPEVSTVGRVVGDIFARIDARAAFPGVLAACHAWGPDVVVSEITEFAGPLAAELVGVPSVCDRHLPAGQGGAGHPGDRRRARRAACALRPAARRRRPAPARPAVPHAAAGRAGGSRHAGAVPRAALPRGAARRAPPLALRRAGRRSAAGLRHLRLGGADHGLLPGPLPRRHRGARVPAGAPAGDRRARPRPRRAGAAGAQRARRALGARRPTSCPTWPRWSATAARGR